MFKQQKIQSISDEELLAATEIVLKPKKSTLTSESLDSDEKIRKNDLSLINIATRKAKKNASIAISN